MVLSRCFAISLQKKIPVTTVAARDIKGKDDLDDETDF